MSGEVSEEEADMEGVTEIEEEEQEENDDEDEDQEEERDDEDEAEEILPLNYKVSYFAY